MKLIHVYSNNDYGAVKFEQSDLGKKPLKEVYDFVKEQGGSYTEEDEEGNEGFTIDCHKFSGVVLTDDFIDFLNDQKDYDMSKHDDWFIVEKE